MKKSYPKESCRNTLNVDICCTEVQFQGGAAVDPVLYAFSVFSVLHFFVEGRHIPVHCDWFFFFLDFPAFSFWLALTPCSN